MKIVILGGGASGIMLASLLSDYSKNLDITILEKNDHIGKKLLLTGNGKCNFSNKYLDENSYNNKFGYEVAKSFDTNSYLNSLGLMSICDQEGRYYPLSLVSNTVLDMLRENIKNVHIMENFNAIRISKEGTKYVIVSDSFKKVEADILVMATGGKTYYKDVNGYMLASMMSFRVTPLRPTLIGLKVNENLASIANIRSKVEAKLLLNGKEIYKDSGEVLFKNDGISGIVMFQLSSMMARNPMGSYEISLDLLKDYSKEELISYLNKYNSLNGLFPKMINQYVLKKANSKNNEVIASTIKDLRFKVVEAYDFKNAQVTSGGIDTNDLTSSFESKRNKNLFAIGELVDVDGLCGGYNLQFAFASASVVAKEIIHRIEGN